MKKIIRGGGSMQNYTKLSKYLCKILRHQPELIGIHIDEQGNAKVEELITLINQTGKFTISQEILETIVREDVKGRYAYNEDHTLIRCVQGHSIDVVGTLVKKDPPAILYHGTASRFLDSILEKGLIKGKRNYVHLSSDIPTAIKVGKRHGEPIVFEVNSKQMVEDGYTFMIAENGVWQIDHVPSQYLRMIKD